MLQKARSLSCTTVMCGGFLFINPPAPGLVSGLPLIQKKMSRQNTRVHRHFLPFHFYPRRANELQTCVRPILGRSFYAGVISVTHLSFHNSVPAVKRPGRVPVTPPGDARPAFPADIALINRIYEDHFGAPLIPEGHLALLNKVPDHDRMEEIVVGGGIAGIIRYFPGQRRWEPVPVLRPANCSLPKNGSSSLMMT